MYETTPYAVQEKGGKFTVEQMWWGKVISTHDSREEAEAACIEEARFQGCLKKVRVR
jgi:hypothetical protein